MRRSAVDFGVPLVTNIKCAVMLVEALARHKGIKVGGWVGGFGFTGS
jgi:hypothetical protein